MVRLGKESDSKSGGKKPSKTKLGFSIAFMVICVIVIINRIVANVSDSNESAANQAKEPAKTEERAAEPVSKEKSTEVIAAEKKAKKAKETEAAEDRAYAKWVVDHGTRYSDVMHRFSTLMGDPQIGDDEWGMKVVVALQDIKTLVKESKEKEKDVPKKFKKVHRHIVNANDEFSYVAEKLPRAIDDVDVPEMEKIGNKIKAGENEIEKASDEILKVKR